MKQSKKNTSKLQLIKHHSFLRCPICKSKLYIKDNLCECANNHSYDIAKKGYVNFALVKGDDFYNSVLFNSRKRLMNAGLFDGLIEQTVLEIMNNQPNCNAILDAGCGEGYFLNQVNQKINEDIDFVVGIDLSKDAIALATVESQKIHWFVADVTNIPCKEESFDAIINVFTPANYSEFYRVLKEDGILIKIVPSHNHFIELREALEVKEYNQDKSHLIESVLLEKFDVISKSHKTTLLAVSKELVFDLITMSPLSRTTKNRDIALNQITVDAYVYVCKKKTII